MQIKLDLAVSESHAQLALTYLVMKDDSAKYWLVPFKKEITLTKPVVKKGKVTTKVSPDIGVLDLRKYDITEWLNDDDIDESLEDLIRSGRLKKFDSEGINGVIIVKGEINMDTGRVAIEFESDLPNGLAVTNYGVSGYRTNHAA